MARRSGNEGSFAWSGGAITLNTADGFQWDGQIERREFVTTPFGFTGVRRDLTVVDGQGTLRYFINDTGTGSGKPTIPDGAQGTLTLTAYSGQAYTIKAKLTTLGVSANSIEAGPLVATYRWAVSADSSSNPVSQP